jgi:hypothetical protein
LLDVLTSSQLSEWLAYDQLEPIGSGWSDWRASYLCSFLTNVVGQLYGKEGEKPELTLPMDYMAVYDREDLKEQLISLKQKQSVEEMRRTMLAIAGTQNRREEVKTRKRVIKPKQ